MNTKNLRYFGSFGVEYFPEGIWKIIGNTNITNIYKIQVCNSLMCGYFCTGFIDFMLKDRSYFQICLQIYFLLMNIKIMTK